MEESTRLSGYDLSRQWFDFCFENPDLIKPNHTALYFFAIEHCNRLGWKPKYGLPTTMAMEAIGIKSYNTYKNTLNDLVEWGFILMIERSKNQYSSNIVALSKFNKALDKALDKALLKHGTKQSESTSESIDSIDKPLTIEPLTKNQEHKEGSVLEKPQMNPETEQVFEALQEKFGIGEYKNITLFKELHSFCMVLQSKKQIPHFIEQFKAYQAYKAKAQEKTHNFKGFIGTIQNGFEDGGWCADNWVHKLNNFKENGKSNSKDADRRNSDREAELADLMAEKFGTQNN